MGLWGLRPLARRGLRPLARRGRPWWCRRRPKSMDKEPFSCPHLELTSLDFKDLKKTVPATVRSVADMSFKYTQQSSQSKVKAVLYDERMAPALRPDAHQWAALCLLAKSSDNIQANIKRPERRRELAHLAAAKRRADLLAAVDAKNETAAEAEECDAEEFGFQLRYRRSRADVAGGAAMDAP